MSELVVQSRAGAVRFSVRVQPRASRTEIVGTQAGALRVRLRAPPVDGAVNEAVVELLARSLGVPKRAIRVVSGMTARTKLIEVDEVDAERVYRLASGTTGQE